MRPISSSSTSASAMLRDELLRRLDQVGVESAGQAAVAGDHQQQNALLRPPRQQRDLFAVVLLGRGLRHIGQHAPDDLRVGARRDHPVLRAAQLGRRDHLHGLGDLLRVLDRADAPAEVDQARHWLDRGQRFLVLGNEALLEFLHHRIHLGLQLIVQSLLVADLLQACAGCELSTKPVQLRFERAACAPPPDRRASPWCRRR